MSGNDLTPDQMEAYDSADARFRSGEIEVCQMQRELMDIWKKSTTSLPPRWPQCVNGERAKAAGA